MEWKELEKMGYQNKTVELVEYWFERKCAVCGEVAYSEHKRVPANTKIDDAVRLRQFDEFLRHLRERGWSTAPPLCKKCRTAVVLQTVEDLLPKGGA